MIRRALITVIGLGLLLAGCASQSKTVDPRTLTYPALQFAIPKSDRVVLKNGIVVYLLEDHELPLVSVTAMLRTDTAHDPPELTGLASITGALLRSGGTEALKPAALDAELEFMASAIESSIGEENGTVSMTTLNRNLDKTLRLFVDVIRSPGLDQGRLDLLKKQTIEALKRQNDDPKGIAAREYRRALYGNHPFGRVATIETVSRIRREEVQSFYLHSVQPTGLILAVSGDFARDKMIDQLESLLGNWQGSSQSLPAVRPPETTPVKRVLQARKQVSQSVVKMGHFGIEKNNPDQYAIRVLDYILGGGFTSRLTQEIRSNRGLAYHAGSRFEIGRNFPGIFTAETETKSASTATAISLMEEIIAGLTREPVSQEELSLAKESIVNSFIFGFTRADSIVSQQARLEFFNYPAGYLENFRDRIAAVTADDVLRVARKYLHPDAMTIMVVGDDSKFDQPLTRFGEVREIKLENFK